MYSVRRDSNNSQYWTMKCQQQQQRQQVIFNYRPITNIKEHNFWSTKFSNIKYNYIQYYPLNNNSIKTTDISNSQDISLSIYRAPCTSQDPSCKSKKIS